jgi:hypothetical protein
MTRKYQTDTGLFISEGLLDLLDKIFPNKLPAYLVSEADIAQLIGQQQVITWIKDKQEDIRVENLDMENQVTIK